MKRIAIVLLALIMVLSTVLVPILANEEEAVIGYSSARVKKADLREVENINDYDADNVAPAYKITDSAGLVKFSELVNGGQDFKSCNIYLAKDIDMKGVTLSPIGKIDFTCTTSADDPTRVTSQTNGERYPFSGRFNGHGHVIDNLVMEAPVTEVTYLALFGLTEGALISNLILGEGCSFKQIGYSDWSGAGYLIGCSFGSTTVDNVYNLSNVDSTSAHAGMVGRGTGSVLIRNSTNCGAMTAFRSASGFVAFPPETTTVENCRNTGDLNGFHPGAFVARARGAIKITNCINNGTLTGTNSMGALGGFADQAAANVTMTDCINYGAYSSKESAIVDPFVALGKGEEHTKMPTITNCQDLYDADNPVEDPTLKLETVVPDYNAAEDGEGDGETAYVTTQTNNNQEPGVLENPTGNEVGYSSARIDYVDTTEIVNILNYSERPDEDAYKITDVAGFLKLDEILYTWVTFAKVTIYLANDIDMSQVSGFRPISYDLETTKHVNGTPRYIFGGIIDGQGEAICNLKMNSTEAPMKFDGEGNRDDATGKPVSEALVCVGLFGISNGTFKNLIIDDSCEFGYIGPAQNPCASALVAYSPGGIEVDNVWNKANISGGRFNGAFTGRIRAKYIITNSTNSGDIYGAQCVGGFVGFDASGGSIDNSRNTGDIKRIGSDTSYGHVAAGFVARARAVVRITNSINNGNIESAANAGAFIGAIEKDNNHVENCTNYGVLKATSLPETIGIAYAVNGVTADGSIMGSCEEVMIIDMTGKEDPTLLFEEIDYNFEPETPGYIPPVATTENTTAATKKPPVNTEQTQRTSVTTNGGTPSGTVGGDTTTDEPKKGGCGSAVFGSVGVIFIAFGAAFVASKKKKL